MGLFDFIKEAGAKVFGSDDDIAQPHKSLRQHVEDHGLNADNIKFKFAQGVLIVSGPVESQEVREKVITIVGNVNGVGQVDDQLVVATAQPTDEAAAPAPAPEVPEPEAPSTEPGEPEWESNTYTVQSGDTLSGIAKQVYGNAGKYMVIFEANTPMLKDPNKIYPGQVLRIPPLD